MLILGPCLSTGDTRPLPKDSSVHLRKIARIEQYLKTLTCSFGEKACAATTFDSLPNQVAWRAKPDAVFDRGGQVGDGDTLPPCALVRLKVSTVHDVALTSRSPHASIAGNSEVHSLRVDVAHAP